MSALTALTSLLHQRGEIPFVEFMQFALYDPQYGYYSAGLPKFGSEGDFITAPELTPLFGYSLAAQCRQILTELNQPMLLEFGAGSGRLCVDLLTQLERDNSLPERYLIMEVSGNLRHRQQQLINQCIPQLAHRVQWLERWPEQPFNGIILANEVLDAMPVHRFLQTEQGIYESMISLDQDKNLCEQFKPCTDQRLLNYLNNALPTDLHPYQSEANLFINDWLQQCAARLMQGAMLIIDYGFPRHEFYHPDRNQGTLMCHYRHHAHPNPLLHLGEQDITAHVDFTHVAEAAVDAGLHVAGFTNQASFLLANGLLSLLSPIDDELQRLRAQQAVKQLIQPSEMGELFKVIALTKQLELGLQGFQLQDKRASL